MSGEGGGLSPGVVVLQRRQALTSLGDQSSGNVQLHSQPVSPEHWVRRLACQGACRAQRAHKCVMVMVLIV